MRRNASLAGRTAYVKTTGTGNTGSNALLERNAGSTAGRPSLTSTGERPFFYYNSDNEELETYFGPTFGWQTIDVLRTQALTGAGAIALGSRNTTLSNATGATYAVTLAAPTAAQLGIEKAISMIAGDGTNTVTLSFANCLGGSASTTATVDAAGETLVVRAVQTGASTYRWLIKKEHGVTLS